MNSHDEDRLSGSLRERAAGIVTAPADLGQVQARARGIRRRRRVVGGLAGAAVVLALAVPLAPRLSEVRADRPVPPATSSQSIPLTARNAPRSGAPRIDYQQGRTLHRTDGSTTELTAAYRSLTPYRSGFLATEPVGDGFDVVQLGKDGQELSRTPGDGDLAVSVDGARVMWESVADSGSGRTVHVDSAGDPSTSSEDVTLPAIAPKGARPVGFLDPDTVVYSSDKPEVRVIDLNGEDRPLEGMLDVRGTSQRDGVVSGLAGFDREDGACDAVRDVTGRRGELWRTCDFMLGKFSPDGRYVLGGPAQGNENGDDEVAVLDARTGAVVAHWQRPRGESAVAAPSVWESDSTLLTPYREDGESHLLRLDVDGGVSEAADAVPAEGTPVPWVFTVRP